MEVNDWTIIEYKNYMGDPAKKVYLGELNPWELIFFDGPGKGIGLVGIQRSGGSFLSDINK